MPRKRYRRKKKTPYVRRRRRYRKRTPGPTSGVASIFPGSKVAKLRYCSSMQLDSVYGALAFDYIQCINPYAPESSGGHQPLGWDQYAAYYNHYVVLGCKINFKVLDYANGQGGPAIVGSYFSDTSVAPFTTYTTFIENRRGPYRILTNQRNQVGWSTKFSTKKFFNITDVKDNQDRLGASTSGSPSEAAPCFVFYQCFNSTDASSVVTIQYTIDYIVAYSEPKDIPAS